MRVQFQGLRFKMGRYPERINPLPEKSDLLPNNGQPSEESAPFDQQKLPLL
jgi:hypothetical protein